VRERDKERDKVRYARDKDRHKEEMPPVKAKKKGRNQKYTCS